MCQVNYSNRPAVVGFRGSISLPFPGRSRLPDGDNFISRRTGVFGIPLTTSYRRPLLPLSVPAGRERSVQPVGNPRVTLNTHFGARFDTLVRDQRYYPTIIRR